MSRTSTPGGSSSSLPAAIRALWREKLAMAIGLGALFCGPYFALMYFPVLPPRRLPLTRLDEWIGFDPRWIWAYQSIYLLIDPLPWIATRREELRRFAIGFSLVCGVSFLFFLLLPIECPRPTVERPMDMYRFLLLYDRKTNAFPSLHAGLLVYTLLFVRRTLVWRDIRRRSLRVALAISGIAWTVLIFYATLATKEHYAVDLVAGSLLAVAGDAVAGPIAAWKSRRSAGSRSQLG